MPGVKVAALHRPPSQEHSTCEAQHAPPCCWRQRRHSEKVQCGCLCPGPGRAAGGRPPWRRCRPPAQADAAGPHRIPEGTGARRVPPVAVEFRGLRRHPPVAGPARAGCAAAVSPGAAVVAVCDGGLLPRQLGAPQQQRLLPAHLWSHRWAGQGGSSWTGVPPVLPPLHDWAAPSALAPSFGPLATTHTRARARSTHAQWRRKRARLGCGPRISCAEWAAAWPRTCRPHAPPP